MKTVDMICHERMELRQNMQTWCLLQQQFQFTDTHKASSVITLIMIDRFFKDERIVWMRKQQAIIMTVSNSIQLIQSLPIRNEKISNHLTNK